MTPAMSDTVLDPKLERMLSKWESDGYKHVMLPGTAMTCDTAAPLIRSAIESAQGETEAVSVKPLEWWVADTGDIIADSLVGRYRLGKVTANSNYRLETPSGLNERPSPFCYWPEQEGKAAAQADYERRIRSCLVDTPAPVPDAVEALRPFAAIADEYDDREDDDFQIWKDFDVLGSSLLLKHFRRARSALTSNKPVGDAVGWKRIDDALISCAGLLKTLCWDEIGDTAAAELDYVRSALAKPEGYAVVPNDPNRLASLVANIRQGESSTPRCEPPGEYEVDIARGWVVRVLKAASMLAAASGKEGV